MTAQPEAFPPVDVHAPKTDPASDAELLLAPDEHENPTLPGELLQLPSRHPPGFPTSISTWAHASDAVLVTGRTSGSLVLSGLTDAETVAVLEAGGVGRATKPRRTTGRSLTPPTARWSQVLELLHRAGSRLSSRASPTSQVAILGDGPLPREFARVLGPMVERVVPESEAVAALETGGRIRPPDLVVIPAEHAVPPLAGRPWQAAGVAQLPVVVSGELLMVGPLIRPRTGPCLTCLDLHRDAHLPGWASWLTTVARRADTTREIDTGPEMRAAATALVALTVSGHQTGQPLPTGVSLSIERPRPRIRHHLWTRHPSCCGASEAGVTMSG